MGKRIFYRQHDEKDCGAAAVAMLCAFHGYICPLAEFRSLIRTNKNGSTVWGIVQGLNKVGFHAEGLLGNWNELFQGLRSGTLHTPFIARVIKGEVLEHFVVVYQVTNRQILLADPAVGLVKISLEQFIQMWTGHIITAEKTESFRTANRTKHSILQWFELVLAQKHLLVISIVLSIVISIITIMGASLFYIAIEHLALDEPNIVGNIEFEEDKHEHNPESEYAILSSTEKTNSTVEWVDDWSFSQSMDYIIEDVDLAFAFILFMYILKAIVLVLRGKALAYLSQKVECSILIKSYGKLLDLPIEFFEAHSTGEIMSRFENISDICGAISGGVLTIVLDSVMVIATGVILFVLNAELFFISIGIILTYLLVMVFFHNPISKSGQETMGAHAEITSLIKQSIDGIIPIKAFASYESKKDHVYKKYESYTKLKVKVSTLETLQGSVASLIAAGGLVIILWTGIKACDSGNLELSILIMFYSILQSFFTSVTNLVMLQADIQTAIISADRLNDIMMCQSDNESGIRESVNNGHIRLNDVCFRHGGGALLFDRLNVEIMQGERIAILGESGSGKSTLAKLIFGIYKPESGLIAINDKPMGNYSSTAIREHIAYVSGEGYLFEDTIRNNIQMNNPHIADKIIVDTCRNLYIDDYIQSLPFGYDTIVDENGGIFSTGQRQLINIARALVRNPKVLILDEATSNLDPITERKIYAYLASLPKEITYIVISHRPQPIQFCDRIIYMEKGTIVTDAPSYTSKFGTVNY